jgi:hypothetical protein
MEVVYQMKRKAIIGLMGLVMIFLTSSAYAQRLWLDKYEFMPNEEIVVHFTAGAGFQDNAWIGIIPSEIEHGSEETNDKHDLTYQYLQGRTSGEFRFKAPPTPGSYDFRMHNADQDGYELASVTFRVTPASVEASLRLEKQVFLPNEEIKVYFTAPKAFEQNAWIGIIPSEVQHGSEEVNDQNDVAYQYLQGKTTGFLTFVAPAQVGSYDFRMHNTDANGQEYASVTFQVGVSKIQNPGVMTNQAELGQQGQAGLQLEKQTFTPNEDIKVSFAAPTGFSTNAWIGIIPSNIPHGNEAVNDQHDMTYQYLQGKTSGLMTFKAPSTPGAYDFRMHDTDDNGKEVAFVSFTVSGSAVAPTTDQGMLKLNKQEFMANEEISVTFTVPPGLNSNAWIGIIPSNIPHGDESVNDQHDIAYQYLQGKTSGVFMFNAPSQPGTYDFRLHDTDNNGKELSSVTFIVSGAN